MHSRSTQCLTAFTLVALAFSLAGCGTGIARDVNKAAVASRISYTDEASRLLAEQGALLIQSPAEDYQVGPEDELEISIFEWEVRNETRVVNVRVGQSGKISLPIIGEMDVKGKTLDQIKTGLEKRLAEDGILQFPRVSVLVKEYNSKRVAVMGAVNEPGVYSLRKNATSLFEALSLAGGVTEEAGQILFVIRTEVNPEQQDRMVRVDLFELLEMGENLNLALHNGDVVNVPKAKEFYVVGFVNKAGGFPLTKPTTVMEAIALAGGLREKEASPSACMLRRRDSQDFPIDLVAISRGEAPDHFLMPGDVIDVRQTALKRFTSGFWESFKALFGFSYSLNS
jgi:polysaccharide export outer membrane protein